MFALLLLPALLHQNSTFDVVLENGRTVGGDSNTPIPLAFQYWGTSDTYLDSTQPLENNGDSHVLEAGPGETILLKFGDLERLGRCKVVKATLYMTPSAEGNPHIASIRSVLVPWGEGPQRQPFFTDKSPVAANWSATWTSRHYGSAGMEWQQNGAAGPGDSAVIADAKLTDNGKDVAISGLEDAVQNMIDKWYENNGFALMFSAPTEFFSCKNVTGKPRLELELQPLPAPTGPDLSVTMIETKYDDANANPPSVWPKDGSGVTYIAHVKNIGNAAADGFIGSWNAGEHFGSSFEVAKKLAPGEETMISETRKYQSNAADHRVQPLGFLIKPKGDDATAGNNYLEIQEDAIPVSIPKMPRNRQPANYEDLAQQSLREINDIDLGKSFFTFAPEGSLERFRLVPDGSAAVAGVFSQLSIPYQRMNPVVKSIEGHDVLLDSADRYPGMLSGGWSANDISVPGDIQLPYQATYNEIFDQYELQPTGLLAESDVAALNANLGKPLSSLHLFGKLPGTILIRAMTVDGDLLPNTELRFYQSKDGQLTTDSPTFRLITGDNGTVLLPVRTGTTGKGDQFAGLSQDGSNGVYLIAATVNGVTDYAWLKAWQLSDLYSRTSKEAAFVELRFNVPFAEVDSSTNLATGAKFSDSAGATSEQLSALADGTFTTPIKVGQWFEIDLGKDEPVTEIDVFSGGRSFWKKFDIITYFSGETVHQASPYAHEIDWDWNLKTRPQLDATSGPYLAYRGKGQGVRYIRFACKDAGAATDGPTEIRVFGAKS